MLDIIRSTTQKAKKEYHDDGWEEISEWISGGCETYDSRNKQISIPFSELRLVVKFRNDKKAGGKINIGDEYVRQFNKYEGQTYTWRTKKVFFEWFEKYDLFPEL